MTDYDGKVMIMAILMIVDDEEFISMRFIPKGAIQQKHLRSMKKL